MVEPGESASPGVPAFLLAQLDAVNVELAVPERHRSALRQDQSVVTQVDSLPGRTFRGQITEISPGAAAQSRSFTVKVRVANSDQTLRPGMFARGTIVTSTRPGVLQIPERALLTTGGGTIVFVVQDGRAVRRAVLTGARQGGFVEIRSGVREGEQVVVEGQEGLADNQAVAPRAPQR
jgi:membrane fusion protein (multidrug efflux system)